jgi:hypothetical protein
MPKRGISLESKSPLSIVGKQGDLFFHSFLRPVKDEGGVQPKESEVPPRLLPTERG